MNTDKSFLNNVFIPIIKVLLILPTKERYFKNKSLFFNWGLIWDHLSPLILIIGLAILVSAGVRGRGFDLEYMLFIFLYWFGFIQIISKIININFNSFFMLKNINKPLLVFISSIINFLSLFLRFIICYFFMLIFGYDLHLSNLLWSLLILSLFGISYGIIVRSIMQQRSFLIDLHGYFLQGMFFLSSIIIPVPLLPDQIRNFLLFNPLVHLFEWMKSPTTGIYYNFINLSYFLEWLIVLVLLAPIFLYKDYLKQNAK